MNDKQRTTCYIVAALVALVFAWEPWTISRARALTTTVDEKGKLFADFTDPLAASDMRIVKYDEDTGALRPFEVAQVDGIWSIPSHQGYPADARDHLARAATALMDVEILGVAGDQPGQHEEFGVVDPDGKGIGPGATGVGTRVQMKDKNDKLLADLIIGKEVKDQPSLRYVRRAGQDQVYRVNVKTDNLSTKFGDWIEKDLLKLNPLDVRAVELNDYSSGLAQSRTGQIGFDQAKRSQIDLAYDDAKGAWSLTKLTEYEDGEPKVGELKENEELNAEKLNALKTALDDLQIVDVERKPAGMKGMQVVEDLVKNRESIQSLAVRGFYPVGTPAGGIEILSSEGEAVCRMKDGLEYVLRFGQLVAADQEKKEEGKDKGENPASRINRYLFVMAQFNPDLIPEPKLEEVPDDDAAADADADAGKAEAKPEGDKKEKTADELAAEEDAAQQKKAAEEKRAEIIKSNKRLQDEYQEKVKKGQEHVKELNDRFADWYYIISDDVYHKIHLGRGEVVKDKNAKAEAEKPAGQGASIGDLDALQKFGLPK